MHVRTILVLIVCLFTGCAETVSSKSSTSNKPAFWGRRIKQDGTEYFRIGKLLIRTKSGPSR